MLDVIEAVYQVERETAEMSAIQRLHHHQQQSGPLLQELKDWMDEQLGEGGVEPNNSLAKALAYLQTHWPELTKFLTVEGCPIDNNRAERALKRVVLLRKNALFYKSEHGAAVGDIIQSVIETCKLNGVNVWEYLVEVVRNREVVRKHPAAWLPWTYPHPEALNKAA